MGASLSVPEPQDISTEDRFNVFRGLPLSLSSLAQFIKDGHIKRILVAAGAGISVAAGIPDFRTPGTGLYDNLQNYDLPTPESVFTLDYFRDHPQPFCTLANELWPGGFKPTTTHHFLRLLELRGVLLRVFTQNIDGLERLAGVSEELLVEAHGSFADAHCIECAGQHCVLDWHEQIQAGSIPRCGCTLVIPPPTSPPDEEQVKILRQELSSIVQQKAKAWAVTNWQMLTDLGMKEVRLKEKIAEAEQQTAAFPALLAEWEAGPKDKLCDGFIKPDIVFFGEGLPARFSYLAPKDGGRADLLIVLGTSLSVMPFAGLLGRVPALCPRLLINRQAVGLHDQESPPMFFGNIGLRLTDPQNYRDVHAAMDCDDGVRELCGHLGWTEELNALERAYQLPASGSRPEVPHRKRRQHKLKAVRLRFSHQRFTMP